MADYQNPREIAATIISLVMDEDRYIHIVLREALDKYDWMEREQKAFITRLTQGTIEHCLEIDEILNQFSKVPVKKMKPLIRSILRMNVYQIIYMDKIPDSAVCNEAVKIVSAHGMKGLKGYVNGVSRSIARAYNAGAIKKQPTDVKTVKGIVSDCKEPFKFLKTTYSTPEWIIRRLDDTYGLDKTIEILHASMYGEHNLTFRLLTSVDHTENIINQLKSDQYEVISEEGIRDVYTLKGQFAGVHRIDAFTTGCVQVQDISSILAGLAVSPKEESVCMDLCAAPGGKTIFLADFMNQTGLVISRDVSDYKCQLIQENVERTGITNIITSVHDATQLDERYIEKADYVLVDAPCSGMGIIGKKGDIKYKMTQEAQADIVKLQRQILTCAQQYVKPNGILVYSTCTIFKEENIENREWFIEHFPFKPDSLKELIPKHYDNGTLKDGYIQLLQGIDAGDGFFIARFRKEA